jgi:hypothetical protein
VACEAYEIICCLLGISTYHAHRMPVSQFH